MARPDNMVHGSEAAAAAARDTAKYLLDIGAVNFRPEDPYTFTSGRVSPSYIDCRRVIAFPEAREAMTAHAVDLIDREIGRDNIDVVAGGETAGIPYAAFVAVALGKPMVYVRKEPKGFGRMAQIEGALDDGARVLLVEDLTTDGGSKVRFVDGSYQFVGADGARVPRPTKTAPSLARPPLFALRDVAFYASIAAVAFVAGRRSK